MELFFITVGMLAFCVAGIGIKLWAKKGGEFAGTCASASPIFTDEGESCTVCGARPDEKCQSETPVLNKLNM